MIGSTLIVWHLSEALMSQHFKEAGLGNKLWLEQSIASWLEWETTSYNLNHYSLQALSGAPSMTATFEHWMRGNGLHNLLAKYCGSNEEYADDSVEDDYAASQSNHRTWMNQTQVEYNVNMNGNKCVHTTGVTIHANHVTIT
eukprot:6377771-Amphidinium_carterae.2